MFLNYIISNFNLNNFCCRMDYFLLYQKKIIYGSIRKRNGFSKQNNQENQKSTQRYIIMSGFKIILNIKYHSMLFILFNYAY